MCKLYDSHNHSNYSHDSKSSIEQLCLAAQDKGLSGVVVSDHCDIQYYTSPSSAENIKQSVIESRDMNKRLNGKLSVLAGVELGEAIWNKAAAEYIISTTQLDVVLSSVHAVRYENFGMPFSTINFSDWNDFMLNEYMNQYFDDMTEMVDTIDMDILTHLTNPLKYINGKYGHRVSCAPYMQKIEKILKRIIEKSIALEINTSCLTSAHCSTMPDESVIQRYGELGGKLITIGSDAHRAECCGTHFDYALNLLKKCGFMQYVYFKDRKCITVKITD